MTPLPGTMAPPGTRALDDTAEKVLGDALGMAIQIGGLDDIRDAVRIFFNAVHVAMPCRLSDEHILVVRDNVVDEARERATHACHACHTPAGVTDGRLTPWGVCCDRPLLQRIGGWTDDRPLFVSSAPVEPPPDEQIAATVRAAISDEEIEEGLREVYATLRDEATHACRGCGAPGGLTDGVPAHWGPRCAHPHLAEIVGWTSRGMPVFRTIPTPVDGAHQPGRTIPPWQQAKPEDDPDARPVGIRTVRPEDWS